MRLYFNKDKEKIKDFFNKNPQGIHNTETNGAKKDNMEAYMCGVCGGTTTVRFPTYYMPNLIHTHFDIYGKAYKSQMFRIYPLDEPVKVRTWGDFFMNSICQILTNAKLVVSKIFISIWLAFIVFLSLLIGIWDGFDERYR